MLVTSNAGEKGMTNLEERNCDSDDDVLVRTRGKGGRFVDVGNRR